MRALFVASLLISATAASAADLASLVDMSFPDGGKGRVFRGADVPFGMMMWGPSPNGYSLTFLSGAEMDSEFQMNLPILPTVGMAGGLSRLVHGQIEREPCVESAEPGYFRSQGKRTGFVTELTATARTGLGRFTFPEARDSRFLFYLHHGETHSEVSGPSELRGFITRKSIRMFFVARFDRPFQRVGTWRGPFTHEGRASSDGANGAYVAFDAREVRMKIGMSWVSLENAAVNLDTESPDWDFDRVRSEARARWNEKLSLIEVSGGPTAKLSVFYTHLFQTFLHPNLASDVNGEYLGFDDRVHLIEPGHPHYANYSGWDIYRTWVPLLSLLLPDTVSDMMRSLVEDGTQGGGLPIWPVENRETGVMSGGSSTPILAGAYAFGARGFDLEGAFALMDRDESDPEAKVQGFPERAYLADYLKLGYLPVDPLTTPGRVSASTTLEFNTGEFALSQLAFALGKPERGNFYLGLADGWKNLFDPVTRSIRPRTRDGSWYRPFDPFFGCLVDQLKQGFDEGTPRTWTLNVFHDLPGLIDRLGGDEAAVAYLDRHFTKLNDGTTFFFGPGLIPHVGRYAWIGNEPEFGSPWEYNWAGAPWRTQALVRRLLDEQFSTSYVGDEDLGAMSAWAVWASLGLYPEVAGVGGLTITSPYFPLARVHLGSGKVLEIRADGAGDYVKDLFAGSSEHTSSWIELSELVGADHPELRFVLGSEPNPGWGEAPRR